MTVASYLTPSGRDIQNLGITPDRILDEPEPLNPGGTEDRWLHDAELLMGANLDRKEINTSEAKDSSQPPLTQVDSLNIANQ